MKFLLFIFSIVCFMFGAVNINEASLDELATLKGIGKKTAKSIIEYRAHNKFESIEDLKKVKGISSKKFNAIKDDIVVENKN